MKVKALVGFSSIKLSMYQGEIGIIEDRNVLDDLLLCKYIEIIDEDKPKIKTPRNKVKADESK